jgi:trk system potassium uptake protein TrkH
VLKIEGKAQDDNYINSILFYTVMYVIVLCAFTLILSFDPALNFEGAVSATISGLNNVGPGLGVVGPTQNYAMMTGFSKTMMSALMLFGRLEIFPLLVMMSPSTWK